MRFHNFPNNVIYEALSFNVVQDRLNGAPMRLELTLVGLLVKLANHYTIRSAHNVSNNER